MSPPRRGRPRSRESHDAVLTAAAEVLDEVGFTGFAVNEVARRSGVSKATIYKHWSGALPIAVEAYAVRVTEAMPTPDTGDAIADLTEQVRRVAALYASKRGVVVAQILAAGIGSPTDSTTLRRSFFAPRREETLDVIRRGIARGQLRQDADPDLILDLLFGPIVFRIFNGVEPIGPEQAGSLADLALQGIAGPGA